MNELKKLKKPVLFVGNAGDGLFPRSLDPDFALKGENQWYLEPRALLKVFKENQWQHFAFGPFLVKSKKVGRTYLHSVQNGKIVDRSEPMKDWEIWRDSVAQKNPVALKPEKFHVFTSNQGGKKIEAMISDVLARGTVSLVRQDGVTFKKVPISKFSKLDQMFIREWREAQNE